jgi:hypothetical protein
MNNGSEPTCFFMIIFITEKNLFTWLHDDTKIIRQHLDVRQKDAASYQRLP